MNTYKKLQHVRERISTLERATDDFREMEKNLKRRLNAEHIDWAFNAFKR